MNKANLKSYAPRARLDFIKAVTERANVLGISASGVVPAEVRGDVALIDGREWPAKVAGQRDELIARIKRHGFEQTMDEVAYTWFNRFAALRYMEIHDYLGHGWRVLSSRDGGLPEILRHASEVTLPGLNPDRAREMQLAGNQDNELYKLLLVAQCNELSRVMPFLFERIDDETELLLPENLLRTDSIVVKLVERVPEEDWQEIEVIGWLYQFYISEKKDQVIGKVVKSEDIPAATQLFTPNWIVQYLVQNSVGRLWLMANPTSTLTSQWPFYIRPAEQTPEVQTNLDALILTRVSEDGETLSPETITVLDPACGSGHILVVAYDVLKAIYLERGYQPRAIPRLILEKNLFGLDIDDRAAQLAAFALLMKARADDRRLFQEQPRLNVFSIRESNALELDELTRNLTPFGLNRSFLNSLLSTFEDAKTLGTLIKIPAALTEQHAAMIAGLQRALQDGDLYAQQAARDVLPLLSQAMLLGMSFDAVIANPPYMGSKGMNARLRDYAKSSYPQSKADLFSMFIESGLGRAKPAGFSSMVTMHNWMFLGSFQELRVQLANNSTIYSLAHFGAGAFDSISGEVVQTAAFVLGNQPHHYKGIFISAVTEDGEVAKARKISSIAMRATAIGRYEVDQDEFTWLPGSPLAFWIPSEVRRIFRSNPPLEEFTPPKKGMISSDNGRFLRIWHEVSTDRSSFRCQSRQETIGSGVRWYAYNKGGESRRWYGNNRYVINWENDGAEVIELNARLYGSASRQIQNTKFYFQPAVTWSEVGSSTMAARLQPAGFIFDSTGPSLFPSESDRHLVLSYLCSSLVTYLSTALNPTLHFTVRNVGSLPFPRDPDTALRARVAAVVPKALEIAKGEWDAFESSWDFQSPPWIAFAVNDSSLASSWNAWCTKRVASRSQLNELEAENDRIWLAALGLHGVLEDAVPEAAAALVSPDREKDCQRLISYAVGCMMGRYSLSRPGLIYARSENIGFDCTLYPENFPADSDGIVPVTDAQWFEDDASSRVREFVSAVWGTEDLEENLAWLAASLGIKGGEAPLEAIQRYLADKFFKDHLQAYKKRPIYWLFSSGKQGAFQALVYLHRYNVGTLARMRAEYVVPLISKVVSRLDMLDKDLAAATSAAARTRLQKQIESLRKKQIELLAYDDKLRHFADMRIALDLDDGVKVNYAKFGDLVAESKAICGGKDED